MSFTVMRYKDGKPAPIRMSIWDAFKGSPNPKSTVPKPCSCCGKIHCKPDSANTSGKRKGTKNDNDNHHVHQRKEGEEEAPEGPANSAETFTEKENKTIVGMKKAGKSWQQILDVLGKTSKSQLQAHWKTIDPNRNIEDHGKGNGPEAISKVPATGKAKGDGPKKKNNKDEGAKPKMKKNDTDEQVQSIDLRRWADRYDNRKWIAAASRHFDLTGDRITPEAARKLAGSEQISEHS